MNISSDNPFTSRELPTVNIQCVDIDNDNNLTISFPDMLIAFKALTLLESKDFEVFASKQAAAGLTPPKKKNSDQDSN